MFKSNSNITNLGFNPSNIAFNPSENLNEAMSDNKKRKAQPLENFVHKLFKHSNESRSESTSPQINPGMRISKENSTINNNNTANDSSSLQIPDENDIENRLELSNKLIEDVKEIPDLISEKC